MSWAKNTPQYTIIQTIHALSISVQREYSTIVNNNSTNQVCRTLGLELPNYSSEARVSVSKRSGDLGIFKTTIHLPPEEVEPAFSRVVDHGTLIAEYSVDEKKLIFSNSGRNIIQLSSPINDQGQQFTCIKDESRIDVLVNELSHVDPEDIDIHPIRVHYNEDLLYGVLQKVFK